MSLKDVPGYGRPSNDTPEENIDRVHNMAMDGKRLTIDLITNAVHISRERVETLMPSDIGMKNVSAQWLNVF